MNAVQYALRYAIAGFIFPALFTLFLQYFELSISFEASLWIENLVLFLWPSSLFMMGTAGTPGINFEILSISIAVNIVLYTILGFLVWLGLNKQRWVLYLVLSLILFWWGAPHSL